MKVSDLNESIDVKIVIKMVDGSTANILADSSEEEIGCTKNTKKKSKSKKAKK